MSDLMFNTIILLVVSIGVCVVIAVVVWLRKRSINKADQQNSELRGKQSAPVFMRAGDWANAAVNLVVGVLLGVAINGLVQLISTGSWFLAVLIAVLSTVFLLLLWFDGLFDKVFPSGVQPARKPQMLPKPLARRLSLPAGLILGVILASLGLDEWLLGWLLGVT